MASLQERDGRWQRQFLYHGKRRTFALGGVSGYLITVGYRKLLSLQEVRTKHRRRSIPRCVSPTRPISATNNGPSSNP